MKNEIKFVKGNLLTMFKERKFDAILQQSNCQFKPNKGIAKSICDMYPFVRNTELQYSLKKPKPFGTYLTINTKDGHIINIYSQNWFGSPNRNEINKTFLNGKYVYDDYENRTIALKQCLQKINEQYIGKRIGLPLIASGLAKEMEYSELSDIEYFKLRILPIIEQTLTKVDVTIVEFTR